MTTLRLDRLLCEATGLTRSLARRAIVGGEVTLNGLPLRKADLHVAPDAPILYRGQPLAAPAGPRYFMLHKPLGVVCATRDGRHRTVINLLDLPDKDGLHPAGRLDIDTTGLVLITDDGDWSHRITHPRRHCAKVYRVELEGPLDEAAARRLRDGGIELDGERRPTAPAQVERLDERTIRLTIHEGKYHQVKRMLAAVGNGVVGLHRERIGPLPLDPALAPGEYRALTAEEVAAAVAGPVESGDEDGGDQT